MLKQFRREEPETVEANRRGQLTPSQRMRLQFLLDAEQLAAGIQLLSGLVVTSLFSCIITGFWFQRGTLNGVLELSPFVALGAFLLWHGGRRFGRLARYRTELGRGHIAQADGRIEWKRHSYHLKVPGGLRVPIDFVLRPGVFRFYYVPYSSAILFAEPLSAPEERRGLLLGALMRARSFAAEDLEANRRLRLRPEQKIRLTRLFIVGLLIKSAAALASGVGLVLFLVYYQMQRGLEYGWTAILAAVPFVLVHAVLVADLRSQLQDLAEGKVVSTQGAGWLSGSWRARWHVGDRAFGVNAWSAHALVPGSSYRAYTLPRSGYLVSIEPSGK